MKNNLTRRDWLKSSLAITAGVSLSSSFTQKLMGAPMSEAERFHWGTKKLATSKVRLNYNENPYGPSEKVREAIVNIMSESNRYGEDEMAVLKELIAKKEDVPVEYIQVGAGSGDVLCQTGAAYGIEGGRIMSAFPTFPLLMNYAELFHATWDKINVNEKLEHDYEAMASAIRPDTKLIFICNPNNPTGTLVDAQKVKSFIEDVSPKTTVYADEAYLEFLEPAQQISMMELVKKDLNVIISRTFSKIHGIAGLRIGYIVARPDIIKKISRFEHDIPVSQSAIAAAQASLGDPEFMTLTRTKNVEARAILTQYLDAKKIVYPKSFTNFVFFPALKDGKLILSKMEEKGFLMRIWDYQQREWCRVSVGTLDQMKSFVKAFDEVIS